MTLCNMSIEAGARAGMVAPDETTIAYVKGKRFAPRDAEWEKPSRTGGACRPMTVRRSTRSSRSMGRSFPVCDVGNESGDGRSGDRPRAGNQRAEDADRRATNSPCSTWAWSRGRGLKTSASIVCLLDRAPIRALKICGPRREWRKGHHVSSKVRAMVVPGSQTVKRAAEQEGLDRIFQDAGFEWRESGCSMCLGMNPDILQPGERCASTSNRNFEGRQGRGGRTHLVSPMMAAAAAIAGHFTDIRNWKFQ